MKKLYWLFAAMLVLSMVLAACGQAATPTQETTAQQPATEAAAPAQTEAPAPAQTEGPAPAAAEGGWCSGTNLMF